MRLFLTSIGERVRYSYWFVPAIMVGAAAGLAFLMGWIDAGLQDSSLRDIDWIYTGGPEGARLLLSTVASSMITVAGVVFSITIVALTLASSQFGPRLLRNFMRDRGNQITLGTFLATFVYCLLVVRTVRGTDDVRFVPQASVTVAVGLALLSLAVLIYFIHHAASSIQAPNVIASVARDLEQGIDALFPEEVGEGADDENGDATSRPVPDDAVDVYTRESGYIQAIDADALLRLAQRRDLVVVVLRRPGDFVGRGTAVVRVAPPGRCDEAVGRRVRAAFVVGVQRSVEQDVRFAFEQLVSVCVRALSPGINDPFTAIQCIEWLGAGLARLAGRKLPAAWRLDEHGQPRVLAHPIGFSEVLERSFAMIRPHARANAAVTVRMLEVLVRIARDVRRAADRRALAEEARILERQSRATLGEERDRLRVREHYDAASSAIADAARMH